MNIEFSVVIPTFNRSSQVKRAIKSALNQTLEPKEVIVVDDASTDDTRRAVQNIDSSIVRYHRHDLNKGGGAARNTGIEKAVGNYIAFLDSDDVWLPTKLEKQHQSLANSNGADVNYTRVYKQDIRSGKRKRSTLTAYSGNVYEELLSGWCPHTTSAFVVAIEELRKVDGFDERFPSYQDYDLWLSLAKYCQFDVVEEPLVIKYHGTSSQLTNDPDAREEGLALLLEKWGNEIIRMHNSSTKKEFYRKKLSQIQYTRAVRARKNGDYRKALGYFLRYSHTSPDRTYLAKIPEIIRGNFTT